MARAFRAQGGAAAYKDALRLLSPLAKNGDAAAQSDLGYMYFEGHGVNRDDEQAVRWYRKAAEQGFARAQFNLGVMYYQGTGLARDKAEAVKWFRKAAANGHTKAQDVLKRLGE